MEPENLQVLPLHKYPQYLKPCCDLINDEWPRSETARMTSLQASRDQLPTSLILINNHRDIIGHCKLTPIPSIPESCFLETVVISKALRGMKLGTHLMAKAEEYCRVKLKLKMLHLSTKGQENFYAKLGYEICAPISIYGGNTFYDEASCSDVAVKPVPIQTTSNGILPPPPPPMPKVIKTNNSNIKTNKTYMFKYLN